jgi:hypothetical protein
MSYYFSPTTLGFYPEEFKNDYLKTQTWPQDCFKISESVFKEFALTPAPVGKQRGVDSLNQVCWVVVELSEKDRVFFENEWISSEIYRVREELEKVQDSDPSSTGSVTDWRNYRKLLRQWSSHENFPHIEYRPIAPDYKE